MYLTNETFADIIANTPLVSIDLVVLNKKHDLLLGERTNAPAKGYWFVPGGRIRKDETLQSACLRLSQDEIGRSHSFAEGYQLGVYEHFYTDNALGLDGITTHYVVIALLFIVDDIALHTLPNEQHTNYRFAPLSTIQDDLSIHENSRAYYEGIAKILSQRM